jgi:hypothetical protein
MLVLHQLEIERQALDVSNQSPAAVGATFSRS